MTLKAFLEEAGITEAAVLPWEEAEVIDQRKEAKLKALFEPRSVAVFLMPYYVKEEKSNLSCYARSNDYHGFFADLALRLEGVYPSRFKAFCDASPVNEVSLAVRAGLGVVGKNGLLLNPRYGSFVFIGEFFSDLAPEDKVFAGLEKRETAVNCLACDRCLRACPTGGITDKTKCVSFINQKKVWDQGDEEVVLASGMAWGCDICQEVCPYNKGEETPIRFFRTDRVTKLTAEELDRELAEGTFSRRAYAWRGEKVVRRNLALLERKEKNKTP